MKKLTLQWRITILTALVLLICTAALTVISIHNAEPLYALAVSEASPEEWEMNPDCLESVGTAEVLPAELAKQQFDGKSILYCGLFTILGTAAVYFVTGQALRPLRLLTSKVNTIDEHNLSMRLPEATSNDEINHLTDGFNRMLSRLDDAFLRQKRFTANAAHELKTPLATLKTGIQVLEADTGASLADYKKQNQMMLESTDRLAGIVDDLLVLASAGENRGEEKETILLEPLFEAICSELEPRLEQKRMTCHIDCGNLAVEGNPAYLYRAFFNLFDNACKYGNENGNISVKAARHSDHVEVLLWDDGPGIAKTHLPYIFDAFYRVDKSRSRAIGGSGLGLSIVKTMIEASDGEISVQSDGKSGTCFMIKFHN